MPSHTGQTTSSPLASCVNPVPSQFGQSINGMREAPPRSLAAPAPGAGAAARSRIMPGILARMRDPVLTAALVAEGRPRRVEEAPAITVRVHPRRRS